MADEDNLTLREKKKQSCIQGLVVKMKLTEEGATPINLKYISLVFAALGRSNSSPPDSVLECPPQPGTSGTGGFYLCIGASTPVYGGNTKACNDYNIFFRHLATVKMKKALMLGWWHPLYLLAGLWEGTVGTAKAVLYDISDNSNQAVSMSMLSISWGLGMVVGPAMGGFLADPAKKWPGLFDPDGLFGEYPYLLASMFPFISCFLIFFLIFFKFDNTFDTSHKRKSLEIEVPDSPEIQDNLCPQHEGQSESHGPLLRARHHSSRIYLGQSVNSLHMETAQTTAFFAQEMLRKREASSSPAKNKNLKSQPMFVSVPNLIQPGSPVTPEPASALFLSTPDIANTQLKVREAPARRSNSFGNHYDLNLMKSNNNACDDRHGVNGNSAIICKEPEKNIELVVSPIDKISVCADLEETEDKFEKVKLVSNGFGDGNHSGKGNNGSISMKEDEGDLCQCVEVGCSSACCLPCQKTSFYKLLRLKNVWTSIMLYVMYSFIIIGVEDIFPVFASTQKDYGGLGFSTDEIGFAIGTTFLPLLFLQIKLYPFLVSKLGIRKVFLVCAICCMVTCQMVPCVRLLNDSPAWLWTYLMLVQVPFKISTNCCFAGTSLLINNSVTPDLAGSANGIAMMATAIGRTIAPTVSGALFSWSVTYGPTIGAPFDTSFPFFILGSLFIVTVIECMEIDPRLDQQRK
ncbi:hypothetical protein EGW08_015364 [Elysia chlorotica]|uniref:Major facilitator superfamily (MFS) profile domain-containing protein n=1 Tax=Elysia chlorotica TaxID=188477 RepID=A0A433T5M9_ELYCH|nr:hypothetical protein EGW08_015364 [Elysia chlorotica]